MTVPVGAVEDFVSGEARKIDVNGVPVAVVRIDDDFYAIGDVCSHADVSLSEGDVLIEERELECWKHGSAFSLLSGEPSCLPATKPVAVFVATVNEGQVWVSTEEPTAVESGDER